MSTSIQSIVKIESPSGVGTGFFVENDMLLTNSHVYNNSNCKVFTQSREIVNVWPIYYNKNNDICVLKHHKNHTTPLPIDKTTELYPVGTEVLTIGHPLGYDFSVSNGIISANNREIEGQKYYQTDAAINPGNSGGPIINMYGYVGGMITLGSNLAKGISFGIPAHILNEKIQLCNILSTDEPQRFCFICCKHSDQSAAYCQNCGNEFPQEEHNVCSVGQTEQLSENIIICSVCNKQISSTILSNCPNCGSSI